MRILKKKAFTLQIPICRRKANIIKHFAIGSTRCVSLKKKIENNTGVVPENSFNE